jgi:two-component system, sensor histidine kinase LadS
MFYVRFSFQQILFIFSLFFFCLCLSVDTFASVPEIIIDDKKDQYPVTDFSFYEDQSGDLTFSQVSSPAFSDNFIYQSPSKNNFGYTKSAIWVKYKIKYGGTGAQDWLLEIAYPLLDKISLFISTDGHDFTELISGDHLAYTNRKIKHRHFIFLLPENLKSSTTIYLRFETESTMVFPMTIFSRPSLMDRDRDEQFIFGIYYGIILIMIFYNFFLFFTLKDKNYILYVFYITCYGLFQASMNGISCEYLWPTLVWWNNISLPYFLTLAVFWLVIFSKFFLDTKHQTPRLDKVLSIFAFFSLLMTMACLVIEYRTVIRISTVSLFFGIITIFIAGIFCYKNNFRPARFFLLAWTILFICILLSVLRGFGLLPSNLLTLYGVQFGSAIEMSLLSLALADRITLLRREREEARIESIRSQQVALNLQEKLTAAYQKFVPQEFLEQLEKKSILDVKLGDHVEKKMTVLFSDIRSFTNLSEQMTPEENFRFVNSYLKHMGPFVRKNHGYIDKFVGDMIMALFPNDAENAINTALGMLKHLENYNSDRKKAGYQKLSIGVGINTGLLMLGTIGDSTRMEGSVISDAVNLASRLEYLTKVFSTQLLISQGTLENLKKPELYKIRFVGRVKVRGKNKLTTVYEIFDCDPEDIQQAKINNQNDFKKAWDYYEQKEFDKASALFEKCSVCNPQDPVPLFYLKRCRQFIDIGTDTNWLHVQPDDDEICL